MRKIIEEKIEIGAFHSKYHDFAETVSVEELNKTHEGDSLILENQNPKAQINISQIHRTPSPTHSWGAKENYALYFRAEITYL